MKNVKVGARYAKALFDLSLEQDILETVYADMVQLEGVYETHREFRLLLSSPIINPIKKKSVLRELFGPRIHILSMGFLDILAENRREQHIGTIAREFIRLYKIFKGIKTVYLRTAAPASEIVRNKVTELLKKHTSCEIELIEETDPGIIGGFVIRFDDAQYDASVAHELGRLRRQFQENAYLRAL